MKTFRIINWIFVGLSLCFLLAIPVLGLGSAAINWNGVCHGFTDGQAPCSWWEYTQNEMFWASFIFLPLLVVTLFTWGLMNLIRWGMRVFRNTNSITSK
ncbi:hypothetical protein [Candidatus Villigracilis affinis]|uniref:hypothetical protein n=1 Tax=Candidatus Villigracilis affinis TaxID=3140682 RepID=UPI001D594B81|nr:hypothetical protein [Anaerolineales bacterium]